MKISLKPDKVDVKAGVRRYIDHMILGVVAIVAIAKCGLVAVAAISFLMLLYIVIRFVD